MIKFFEKGDYLFIIADSGTLISYACGFYMWSEQKATRLKGNFFISYKETL